MLTIVYLQTIVKGHIINLAFLSAFIVLALLQRLLLRRENRRKLEENRQLLTIEDKESFFQKELRIGDKSIDFVYDL